MANDTLRSAGDSHTNRFERLRPGTVTGTAAKGYGEHEADGSEYDKYGNRIDYNKLTAHTFK